jgi:hypothetical protein
MTALHEVHRIGADYLRTATTLLQRVRRAHATAGLLEAADLQWWWRTPRTTDAVPQLFWVDASDQPAAAVIATDWGDTIALDPIVLPDASTGWTGQVIERGLAHARACGFGAVEVVIDRDDHIQRQALGAQGFTTVSGDAAAASLAVSTAWLSADARPPLGRLHEGYRLARRTETGSRPHHLARRNGPAVESRLRETSLYRPELDLLVLDRHDEVAAYGLFWFDPASATGLVEPMRTEDGHQRRGLARHVLAQGIEALAQAGARRIKVCYRPDHAASRDLYLGAAFETDKQTVVFARTLAGDAGSPPR